MKNAQRLIPTSSSKQSANNSQVNYIKSFLSAGNSKKRKDSNHMRSMNSSLERSGLTKSTERIFVDLSQNDLNAPLIQRSISPTIYKKQTTQKVNVQNKKSLNNAIYDALILNKTSILQKTIADMNRNNGLFQSVQYDKNTKPKVPLRSSNPKITN